MHERWSKQWNAEWLKDGKEGRPEDPMERTLDYNKRETGITNGGKRVRQTAHKAEKKLQELRGTKKVGTGWSVF